MDKQFCIGFPEFVSTCHSQSVTKASPARNAPSVLFTRIELRSGRVDMQRITPVDEAFSDVFNGIVMGTPLGARINLNI